MQKKPRVFKAIATALLCLAIFGAVYLLAYLLLGGIIYVLSLIPVINWLVDLLFYIRGDTPDLMLSLFSPIVAYYTTMAAQEYINKEKPTRGLSCILLGIIITIIHVLSLVTNLIYGDGILKNIIQAIVGIVIFSSGRGMLKESDET